MNDTYSYVNTVAQQNCINCIAYQGYSNIVKRNMILYPQQNCNDNVGIILHFMLDTLVN